MVKSKNISSVVSETQKLKAQIEVLHMNKKSALGELGNTVYENSSKGLFDGEYVKERCEDIKKIDNQLKEKEEVLVQIYFSTREIILRLNAIAVCDCGAELYEDTNFCSKCGGKVGT